MVLFGGWRRVKPGCQATPKSTRSCETGDAAAASYPIQLRRLQDFQRFSRPTNQLGLKILLQANQTNRQRLREARHYHQLSQSTPTITVITVSGAPTLRYCQKPIWIP